MEFRGGILFCPCCCSPLDLMDPDQTAFECVNCSQTWSMLVDVERLANASIA